MYIRSDLTLRIAHIVFLQEISFRIGSLELYSPDSSVRTIILIDSWSFAGQHHHPMASYYPIIFP